MKAMKKGHVDKLKQAQHVGQTASKKTRMLLLTLKGSKEIRPDITNSTLCRNIHGSIRNSCTGLWSQSPSLLPYSCNPGDACPAVQAGHESLTNNPGHYTTYIPCSH